jgi:hypothetical protein
MELTAGDKREELHPNANLKEKAALLLPLLSWVHVRMLPFLDPDLLFQHYEIHCSSHVSSSLQKVIDHDEVCST